MIRISFKVVESDDDKLIGQLSFSRHENGDFTDLGSTEVKLEEGSTQFTPWKGEKYLPEILRDDKIHEAAMKHVQTFFRGWKRENSATSWLEEK